MQNLDGSGLSRHLGKDKIGALPEERYCWPRLKRGVGNFVRKCYMRRKAKGKTQNTRLYTPFTYSQ